VPLQEWIHHWEEGAGVQVLKVAAAVLGFAVVAALFDALACQGFSSEEAMETAALARNLARGKGYTTQSIRPLALYLMERGGTPGRAGQILRQPVPDLGAPPVYPALLAGLMAVLPFDFTAPQSQYWYYQPERWIAVFNQVLFFVAVLLLFCVGRRLFDARVAWLSAVLFTGSNLFWKFTAAGLSTLWLVVVLLALVWCLDLLRERAARAAVSGSALLAALAGVLTGVGGLSRYAFGWMILPVLLFVALAAPRRRGLLCAAAAVSFLIVMGPWVARNCLLSGACFGTAGYALVQQTPPFPADSLERSFDPQGGLRRVGPLDVVDKFLANAREMWRDDLPRLGGNWVSAFFLVGLLVPFRNPALGRMRVFLLCAMVLLFIAQAAGRTHLSAEAPEINSENLLALLAPLVFVFGVALFYTLVDQLNLATMDARGAVIGGFIVITCAPLLVSLLVGHDPAPDSPYSPLGIQRVARLFRAEELMVSDVPGAVAWYGDRQCGWLPLDDDEEFFHFNGLKPIKAVYLTQRTTNERLLSQMIADPKSWGHFIFECMAHGEVPTGFPLKKAPSVLLPDQMLVSDQARWRMPP
jgi:hypothetical protein